MLYSRNICISLWCTKTPLVIKNLKWADFLLSSELNQKFSNYRKDLKILVTQNTADKWNMTVLWNYYKISKMHSVRFFRIAGIGSATFPRTSFSSANKIFWLKNKYTWYSRNHFSKRKYFFWEKKRKMRRLEKSLKRSSYHKKIVDLEKWIKTGSLSSFIELIKINRSQGRIF